MKQQRPVIEDLNLAELWTPAKAYRRKGRQPVTENVLCAGYVVRYYADGPAYAWVLGCRIGAFPTDEDAHKAVQDKLRELMLDVAFKRPDE